jgi:heat shock protein HslJ
MKKTAAPLLALVVSLAALGPAAAPDAGAAAAALEGTRWRWVRFTEPGGTVLVPAHPENYWVEFLPGGEVSLLADCNRGHGRYSQVGEQLQLEGFASTLMACAPGSLDSRYTQLLTQAARYHLQDGALELTLRGGGGVMRFSAEKASAGAELTGTRWNWLSLLGSDGVTAATEQPEAYQVEFLSNGRLGLHADCNRGGGTWVATPSQALTLEVAVLTRAMCPPGSLSARFVELLPRVSGYRFEDGSLLLTLKRDGGTMRFGRTPAAATK